jgi:flagellar basal-body rod modification protein FlgD
MATQIAGIWNQLSAAHQLNNAQSVKSQDTGTSSSSSDDSATISANDFLTLLVTEMQNQDPTADTDPNEYINQLVQVNSLEQLISINQTLTTDSTATPASPGVKTEGVQPASAESTLTRLADGNLTVPANNPAAQRIAESLATHSNGL